jgi:O-antigen/teichoic acid export membrane protein
MIQMAKGILAAMRRVVPAGSLRRSVAVLAGGNVAAQAVTLAAAPILTRIYSPADYGVLTVMSSMVAVLVILATCRFQLAIPLPQEAWKGRQLLVIALCLAAGSSMVLALLVWMSAERLFGWFGLPGAIPFWWFIPAAVLAIGAYETLSHWTLRRKDYRLLTRTRMAQAATGVTASIGLGVLWAGPLGLLIGAILFQATGLAQLGRRAWSDAVTDRSSQVRTTTTPVTATFREYLPFAGYSSLGAVLNSLAIMLAPLLIARLYGDEASGAFGLAYRMITVPLLLVGTAVSQVFLAEAASCLSDRSAHISGLHQRITGRMVWFAMGVVGLGLMSPTLFPIVFGTRWVQAGQFAAWMSLYCAAQMVVSPASNLAVLLRRQDVQCSLDLLRVLMVVPALLVPHRFGASATQTVACYSLAMLAMYGVYYAAYSRLARRMQGHPAN